MLVGHPKHHLVAEVRELNILVDKCPRCDFRLISGLQRELLVGRKPDSVFLLVHQTSEKRFRMI